jgi:hypothetical protein
MPAETLHLHYRRDYRTNRRRPKPLTLVQTITRLFLLIFALFILSAVLIKSGLIREHDQSGFTAFLKQTNHIAQSPTTLI